MTRIIAGQAGGLRLAVPAAGTRPTSDRVRESLFGALESADAFDGARVLDLYAGSGALGLEALSRGAASADLVELSKAAAGVVRRNAQAVSRMTGRPAQVHHLGVHAYLLRATGPYDLVFSDPPYDIDDAAMTADLIALAPLLSDDALVIIERARRSTPPDLGAAGLEQMRSKVYGDTALWWAQPAAESQSR
ncbi:16S rRNA (guanine(966)-N(2))-methyltransferase RsmD [Microbacterium sp. M28]|uniref:16S rRNA (guanine(966)-N(2))-methyltransferase RsmD n=1 Tax=Microbacterium sp. M28 TaxID=2962064 RepID=UPI0021F3DFA3|nr:16S rRNA (guanine(966)-N(2))-methyltransferase RsmD [Microbacterium sp. M28]UYO98433.1 16S rRNA (guanine(966)-N(2))-methyltransferase RsmD [Microbacterium sp. M28]